MDAQCYISTFSLDRWCFRWIILHGYDSAFYIVLWLLLLLYWFLWHYWLVVSWSGGHNYMDLVVSYTMYWCPYSDFEVLDLYSLVFTLLRENRGSHSHHLFWLASVGFIIHCLHPSITFQFCFNPTYYLTCGMEDLSPLEPLLDKPPYLYCVSALSWWQNLPLVSWIVCLNHSGQLSRCLALCRTPLVTWDVVG